MVRSSIEDEILPFSVSIHVVETSLLLGDPQIAHRWGQSDLPAFLDYSDGSLEAIIIADVVGINDELLKRIRSVDMDAATTGRVHDHGKEGEGAFSVQWGANSRLSLETGVTITEDDFELGKSVIKQPLLLICGVF
jgi:hypothetical protein